MDRRKLYAELDSIFGAPHTEAFASTSQALNSPSEVSKELALQAIESMDLSQIMKDLGALVAGQIAIDLSAMSLKAADYANMPDMPQMVADRLGKEIQKAPTQFVAALIENLKLRG
jgi:hypothetical protein